MSLHIYPGLLFRLFGHFSTWADACGCGSCCQSSNVRLTVWNDCWAEHPITWQRWSFNTNLLLKSDEIHRLSLQHMAVIEVQHPSSPLTAKLLWIKVLCIWSHSLSGHSGFCFIAPPGAEEDLVWDTSVAEHKKLNRHKKGNSSLCDKHSGIKSANLREFCASYAWPPPPFFLFVLFFFCPLSFPTGMLLKNTTKKKKKTDNSKGRRGRKKDFQSCDVWPRKNAYKSSLNYCLELEVAAAQALTSKTNG